jgi:hypothetical protein
VVKQKPALVVLLLLATIAVWLLFFRGSDSPAVGAGSIPTTPRSVTNDVPWIHLERLKETGPGVELGRKRSVFEYKVVPPPVPVTRPPVAVVAQETPEQPMTPPPTPPPPPPNIKFMGVVNAENGPKIAVILTEQKEPLHGREGDVLAGRFKIVKIGLETLEIQDIASGQKHTIRIGGQ